MTAYPIGIVGESFQNDDGSSRQEEIKRCSVGESVALERDPHNKYDPNCVKVISAHARQIGNISRSDDWICERLDRGGFVDAQILSINHGAKGMLGVVICVRTSEASEYFPDGLERSKLTDQPPRGCSILLVATVAGALSFLHATPIQAQLFGPGKFKIETVVDRFATDGLANVTGKNNRVSKKSPAGGIYIDAGGIYLEPDAVIRQRDGSLVSLAFLIHNETESDTLVGRPNSLGTLRQITFIIDGGKPIAFPITDALNKTADTVQYNSITHSASSGISERGLVTLTPNEFHRIANASNIAIKLEGSDRSVVFNERDISKNFLPNLKAFEVALPLQK